MAKADGAETQIGKREQVSKRNSPPALKELLMTDERHARAAASTRSSRAGRREAENQREHLPLPPDYDAAGQANYSRLIVSGV